MSNGYAQASEMWKIPNNKRKQAQQLVNEFLRDNEESNIIVEMEDEGLWVAGEEFIDAEAAVQLAELLVDKLGIGPLCMEIAYTCSRPVCGAFGGSAFRVEAGKETKWISTGTIRNNEE